MTSRARWLTVAAIALLASAYVLPLWRVDLIAPQYPEGLGMLIRIDGVDGLKENDLNSINLLNHYIGMKEIVPDAIPELRWMPWILAGLIAGGLAVAATGRRGLLHVWGGALGLLLLAGLWDYWRWGYDYGHDIDREHAIIKIPEMTYQPPLIGSKKLLNFTAKSWPAAGGVAMGLAALLVVFAVVDSRRRRLALVPAVALAVGACGAIGPRAIALNEDQCGYCRMEITDARFGAQVVTRTGKVHVFDAVECLTAYLRAAEAGTVRSTWVADAERPSEWVAAEDAGYLQGSDLRGPMGRIVAFASPEAARAARATLGGTAVTWQVIVADSAGDGGHRGHAGH